MTLTPREQAELKRLLRDLARGRIAPTAAGNAQVRIAELRRKRDGEVTR